MKLKFRKLKVSELLLSVIAVVAVIVATGLVFKNSNTVDTNPEFSNSIGPKLNSKSYCSDVCPKYTRNFTVYEGVNDQAECESIDGQTIKDVAWGGYIGCRPRPVGEPSEVKL